jgi:CheY-like chemotaxis protein
MGSLAGSDPERALVLVVDDEDLVREFTARILRESGHTVLVAHDGLEALGLVERYDGAVQLVVTDVTMPRLTGTELATRIKQRWPGLPVLYVSGGAVNLDDTATPLLKKPFSPDALRDRANALLAAHASGGPRPFPGL